MRRRAAVIALLGGLFLVVAVVMTFPSITKWRSSIPGDYGDAFFSQWLLQWDVRGLLHRSVSVFHPNMFWPNHNTLVYSDTELAAAPVAAVLGAAVGWPVAYNLIYLASWVASQVATYLLARWFRASRAAAVVAAFVFSFAAVHLGHYNHFPLLMAWLAPVVVLMLVRFLEERRWWQALAFGVSAAALFLNAGYIAAALAPLLLVVIAGWLVASRLRPGPRFWAGLGVAALVAVGLTYPVLKVYGAEGDFLTRHYAQEYAVTPRNFLSPAVGTWLYGSLDDHFDSPYENRLFPGFVAVALGVAGGVALWASRRRGDDREATATDEAGAMDEAGTPDGARRRALLLVVLGTLPALVLSFGRYQFIGGTKIPLPLTLFAGLPGLRSLRGFARLVMVPVLGLALLAAVGFDRLVRGRQAVMRITAAVVVGAVLLAEYKARIGMTPRIDKPQLTAVNRALARLPDGPVVELPMGDTRGPFWAYVEAPRLQLSTIDWKPRVNGYSGYSPLDYERSIDLFNGLAKGGPASSDALALIDELDLRYIVIRTAPLDPDLDEPGLAYEDEAAAARIVASLPADRVANVSRAGAAVLVELRPPAPGTGPSAPTGAPPPSQVEPPIPGLPPLPTMPPLLTTQPTSVPAAKAVTATSRP